MRTCFLLTLCVACGGTQPQLATDEPRGWMEHMELAEEYERRARVQEEAAAIAESDPLGAYSWDCGDPDLNDQLTTGGLRVTMWEPCLDLELEAMYRHRAAAEREERMADRHRRIAGLLARDERIACEGLPESVREHSTFERRSLIERVEPVYGDEETIGARVLLRKQPGMTAATLTHEIACHRARWALQGMDPKAMPDNPTLVEGSRVRVRDRGEYIEVTVLAEDAGQALVALARARGELVEQIATP